MRDRTSGQGFGPRLAAWWRRRRPPGSVQAGDRDLYTSEKGRLLMAVAVVLLAGYVQGLPLLRTLENRFYDLRIRLLATQHRASPEIVVVAIDDLSLRLLEPAVGRWPWPRAVLGSVIDYCSSARAIALDILLPEGDWQYQSSDRSFVEAVQHSGRVINAIHLGMQPLAPDLPPALTRFALTDALRPWTPRRQYDSVLMPYPELLAAGAGVGHVNPVVDEDGVTRWHALVAKGRRQVFPSLALAAAMQSRGLTRDQVRLEKDRLQVGPWSIPVDGEGRFRLSPSRWPCPRVRIVDVIDAWRAENRGEPPRLSRREFEGKIVLIGSLATGLLEDKQVTSLSADTGGIDLVATAVDNILQGRTIADGSRFRWLLIATLVLGPVCRRWQRPRSMFIGTVALGVVYLVAVAAALFNLDFMLPMTGPLLGLLLSSVTFGSLYWYEERQRRREMETLDTEKEKLTAMVVHDLRNALAPVVSGLSLAEVTHDAEFVNESFLPLVKDSSEHLLGQINALLDIRRMQTGSLQLQKEWIETRAFLDDLVSEYRLPAQRAGKALKIVIEPGPPIRIFADPDIMDRIVRNLIWNSIKYATPDTEIELGFTRAIGEYGGPELFLRNHCAPIVPERQRKIFEAFSAPRGTAAVQGFHSIGLGLAFCRLAIEAHGGTIQMESPCLHFGDGVQFTVSLPPMDESDPP